jgi:hypothetical protein
MGDAIAFPTSSHDAPESPAEYWDGRTATRGAVQRTVRRKKSSFDLRHVFKTGGIVPNAPNATSVSVL